MRVPIAVVGFFLAGVTLADRIHVDINTPFDGDGSTWSQAMRSLTDALALAQPGDEVWVADGVYGIGMSAGRDESFVVPTGVALHGGFIGGENFLSERPADFGAAQTFLGGAQNDAHSVVRLGPGTGDTIIDRFIIRNGNANGDPAGLLRETRGAGIFANLRGDLLIRDVNVRDSDATGDGGGLYAFTNVPSSRLTLERVRFNRCTAGGKGGGAAITLSSMLTDCDFADCEAFEGGGLHAVNDIVIDIVGGSFIDNRAIGLFGGGASIGADLDETASNIRNVVFRFNVALAGGGAIAFQGESAHIIISSVIEANLASSSDAFGGGILALFFGLDDDPRLAIENTLIAGNEAGAQGGGMYLSLQGPSTSRITNCTIVGNEARTQSAGGVFAQSSTINVENTIVWDNQSGIGSGTQSESLFITSSTAVTNSLVEHWGVGQPPLPGVSTSGDDPMLVDPDGPDNNFGTPDDNARLMPGSPAIDAGDSSELTTIIEFDVYGDPRRADDTGTPDTGVPSSLGPTVDIGAAEFQGTTPGGCIADTNGNGVADPGDFTAWIAAYNSGDLIGDANQNGVLDPGDFTAWIAAYNMGC